MEELVVLINNEVVCTSLQVAEKFEKRHDRVLRAIDDLKIYSPQNWGKSFKEGTYKDASGKNNKMYYMNRDGFSIVAMGFTGKKAIEWKWKYINAFNAMEEISKERNTQLWFEQRQQGKCVRKSETDTIKDLVEYAKEQGSTHSDMLYMTYSKLANGMCGISDRDSATLQQLNELSLTENIILNQVRLGMEQGLHYKQIYKACKEQIELFRNVAFLNGA